MCSNPSKNFMYFDFYLPDKHKTIESYRKFIQALVVDNEFISQFYIDNLHKLKDNASKERLLYGNWEYDDDPSTMINFDAINDLFTNKVKTDKKYISVDVARFGRDYSVVYIWHGLQIIKMYKYPKNTTKWLREEVEKIRLKDEIMRSHVIYDEDGVGGGCVDEHTGVKGFVGNSSPFTKKSDKRAREPSKVNYSNLRSQCYDKLADYVNSGKIGINENVFNNDDRKSLSEELEQIKRKDIDKDSKFQVVSKDIIKEKIGRSPDFSDTMMMRMYWEVGKKKVIFSFV